MKKILYYSDCDFFAGCENMLANFSKSDTLKSVFNTSFIYRRSMLYKTGLQTRTNFTKNELHPTWVYHEISSFQSNRLIKFLYNNIFFQLFKYQLFVANIIILYKKIKNASPDVVHINNGGFPGSISCSAFAIAARIAGVKNIYYIVNNIIVPYTKLSRLIDLPIDFATKNAVSSFITGSKFAGNVLKRTLKPKSVLCLHNGITPRESSFSKESFREILNIPKDAFTFGIVANLEKRKGHIFLLEAFNKLLKKIDTQELPLTQDIYLLIEGTGPEDSHLRSVVKELNLKDRVLFLNSISNIANFYEAIDILVLSSIYNEDFPNVILEAFSKGIPAIGTMLAGIPEQIIQNKTGLLVPTRNSDSLEKAMLSLYKDDTLRKEISANALRNYNSYFSAHAAVDRYLELYTKN